MMIRPRSFSFLSLLAFARISIAVILGVSSMKMDISPKMLESNENAKEKILGDIEKKLPFNSNSFDSITAIFILNYVQNLSLVLEECKRVLKRSGKLVVALSGIGIHLRHKKHQKHNLNKEEWHSIFKEHGFVVEFLIEENIWFFVCRVL